MRGSAGNARNDRKKGHEPAKTRVDLGRKPPQSLRPPRLAGSLRAAGRRLRRVFDIVHACNPPDLFFLIGGFFKLFGKKFVFDHHDINPELYEAKFGRRDFLHRLLLRLEYWTFRTADVSIATNESYRRIAIGRGRMPGGLRLTR